MPIRDRANHTTWEGHGERAKRVPHPPQTSESRWWNPHHPRQGFDSEGKVDMATDAEVDAARTRIRGRIAGLESELAALRIGIAGCSELLELIQQEYRPASV